MCWQLSNIPPQPQGISSFLSTNLQVAFLRRKRTVPRRILFSSTRVRRLTSSESDGWQRASCFERTAQEGPPAVPAVRSNTPRIRIGAGAGTKYWQTRQKQARLPTLSPAARLLPIACCESENKPPSTQPPVNGVSQQPLSHKPLGLRERLNVAAREQTTGSGARPLCSLKG